MSPPFPATSACAPSHTAVAIPAGTVRLEAELTVPSHAFGLVVFAHGSGSSHLSPRNQQVAHGLHAHGCATLLCDLLTRYEVVNDFDACRRFDIPLLTERLLAVTRWAQRQPETQGLPLGYFGASTGAAAAFCAAVRLDDAIRAIVTRGGRPDLAAEALPSVRAATLLIVGGWDDVVLGLNQSALRRLRCEKRMEIIPRATHLFEEPGALEQVAGLAEAWFGTHLGHDRTEEIS